MGEEGEKSRVDIPTIQAIKGGNFPLSCLRLQASTALYKLTTWQIGEQETCTCDRVYRLSRMAVQRSDSIVIAEGAIVLAQRDKTYRLFKLKKGK